MGALMLHCSIYLMSGRRLSGHAAHSHHPGREVCYLAPDFLSRAGYLSQTDGLWRFAAPLSFASQLLASADRLPVRAHTQGKTDMPIGTVKFFNPDKGFGFIAPEGGGNDAFVHISAVEKAGMRTLDKEQRVSYDLEQDQRGKTSAVNLQNA